MTFFAGIYAYGFEKPSAIQQRAVKPILLGRDVIAQAQSGTSLVGGTTTNKLRTSSSNSLYIITDYAKRGQVARIFSLYHFPISLNLPFT